MQIHPECGYYHLIRWDQWRKRKKGRSRKEPAFMYVFPDFRSQSHTFLPWQMVSIFITGEKKSPDPLTLLLLGNEYGMFLCVGLIFRYMNTILHHVFIKFNIKQILNSEFKIQDQVCGKFNLYKFSNLWPGMLVHVWNTCT